MGKIWVPKIEKKLTFYVDTECSFSNKNRCSYYSSKNVQEQAGYSAKQAWGAKCCPIVYIKTIGNKYAAFCPTRGGPWGEQLPTPGARPGPNALKVEVKTHPGETWGEILEKAAKTACETKCLET